MGSFLGSFWGHFGGPNFCKIFWTPNRKIDFATFRGVPKRCQKWHENDIIFVTFSWHFCHKNVSHFFFSTSLFSFFSFHMSCNDVVTSLHDVKCYGNIISLFATRVVACVNTCLCFFSVTKRICFGDFFVDLFFGFFCFVSARVVFFLSCWFFLVYYFLLLARLVTTKSP